MKWITGEAARADLLLWALLASEASADAFGLGDRFAIGARLHLRAGDAEERSVEEIVGPAELKRNEVLVDHRPMDRLTANDRPNEALATLTAPVVL
jgi:hypothetical protein